MHFDAIRDRVEIRLPRPLPHPPQPRVERESPPPRRGEAREFWVWDTSVMPPGQRRVRATARAVSEGASIFVEDALWGRSVTEEQVEELARTFFREGPPGSVNPSRGIYAVDTDYFGEPPVPPGGSRHTVVLLADLPAYRGTVLDGYFNPFDQMTEEEASRYGQHSNEANVVYLNATGPRAVSSDYMKAVLAHEFTHLLHHGHDPEEEGWLGEMVSEAAMLANGYHTDMGHVARYASHPERPLRSDGYVDYGAQMLFAEYLLERYGRGFYRELIRAPEHGVASLDATLQRMGRPERFPELYAGWIVANYADSQGAAAPGMHYARLDLPPMKEAAVLEGPRGHYAGTLAPTAANYVRIEAATDRELHFQGEPGLVARLIRLEGARSEVRAVGSEPITLSPGSWAVAVGNLGPDEAAYRLEIGPPAA